MSGRLPDRSPSFCARPGVGNSRSRTPMASRGHAARSMTPLFGRGERRGSRASFSAASS